MLDFGLLVELPNSTFINSLSTGVFICPPILSKCVNHTQAVFKTCGKIMFNVCMARLLIAA